jgi:hypothetical protein
MSFLRDKLLMEAFSNFDRQPEAWEIQHIVSQVDDVCSLVDEADQKRVEPDIWEQINKLNTIAREENESWLTRLFRKLWK